MNFVFLGFLCKMRKKEKKAGFELIGSRRGEERVGALWSLVSEEFSGMGVALGSKSAFRVVCVILLSLGCCCVYCCKLLLL